MFWGFAGVLGLSAECFGRCLIDLLGDVLGDIPSQDVPDEANTIEGVAKVHLESYATFLAIEEGPLSKLLLMAA